MQRNTLAIVALAVFGTFAACYLVLNTATETNMLRVNPTALHDLYTHWKSAHNLTYGGPEDAMRFNVFSQNYRTILTHNAKKDKTFELGLNQFAALTSEEFSAIYLGYHAEKKTPETQRNVETLSLEAVPASIDWSTKGGVTPIKNQGQCGSCWAFSSTGALEGLNFVKNGKLNSFSEQQLVDCSGKYGNQGCNGGLMDQAFTYVAANGIVQENAYPYKAVDGKCNIPAGDKFKNTGHKDVTPRNPDQLKAAVAQGPVSVAIEADTSTFQLYKSGVITGSACGTQLDHGVLLVGYGSQNGKNFWKVKNSWGASWGQQGFVLLGIESGAGVCGIQLQPSYPTA